MTVTQLHAPDTARVSAGRWQPSRAGIVNIWRYLDEVFAFHRGRLLLRGANGTGKSKALELLLPYLFDANLRAHRLSTFGSDRTMHWNLMGDGYPHATRVGYVWLEFARTDSDGERFVTCGARLQASTSSSSVSATYFLTTQRIGNGLSLLRDGRPLTRADLTEAIGGHGRVFEGATEEYRAAVRATLFPGVTREKYDALLVALLQLRTPKLSEHLNPDELSGLLSRSLPPVDADDVTEIAEGFERLDRHAEALETLAEETRAARRLADVARGYARRVLRAAADRMIKATSAMDQVTRRARTSAEALGAARTERDGVTTSASRLGSERTGLVATAEGIQISDAYTEGRQIPTLRADAGTAARRAGAAEAEARR
ncbi:MAG: TIGR02680 family protein, partial [Actinomycetota bacterium]|nr:TIGR02680 family protein [Actinomycetota bacterium]